MWDFKWGLNQADALIGKSIRIDVLGESRTDLANHLD